MKFFVTHYRKKGPFASRQTRTAKWSLPGREGVFDYLAATEKIKIINTNLGHMKAKTFHVLGKKKQIKPFCIHPSIKDGFSVKI